MGGEIDGLLDGLARLLTQGVHAAAPVRELCASLSQVTLTLTLAS